MLHLAPSQFSALAKHIFNSLSAKNFVQIPKEKEAEGYVQRIAALFQENLEAEQRLNDDAKKLLAQHKTKVGLQIDEEKAFLMIKRQLAKERDFTL